MSPRPNPAALWLLGWLLLFIAGHARAELAVPPVARVTDQTASLDAAAIQALAARLAALERAKGSQLALLIVPTTRPEAIEQYALRVAETWKLGRKGVDDGALLLVAKDDRALRIEVGYGLEGVIPDAVAKRVIAEIIVPRFRAGDFPGGVAAGMSALIGLVEGEPLPPPRERAGPGQSAGIDELFGLGMLFVFVVGGVLRALLGSLLGAAVAGGVALLGAWLLIGSLVAALVAGLIVFLFTLFGVARLGGGGRGGLGGGGFGGGGLRGGFGGGGGGFGGGGASGRW